MEHSLYRRSDTCRLCHSTRLEKVLTLKPTPPANACVRQEQLGDEQPTFPLNLALCANCGHTQLIDVVDPAYLFSHYVYASGAAPAMVRHLHDYGRRVIERLRPSQGDLVVEVGSNDGTFLRTFRDHGLKVLGIDPAKNIAEQANKSGIETLVEFFNAGIAREVRAKYGAAKIVCANHVFAHVADMQGFVDGARHLLADDGVFVFEVGYLVDVYEKSTFDTIYHEHLDYHRVGPLRRFFEANGLLMFDAERTDIQGGSLRGYVSRPGARQQSPNLRVLEDYEHKIGLDEPVTFRRFADRINRSGLELTTLLAGLKAQGKKIAAYGLPAKATTLMYHFDLDQRTIEYVVDDAPLKVGLFSPGLHVPILSVNTLYERHPDYVVVLAWNFADTIITRHKAFTDKGGRFIVPLPSLAVR
ncbi:MAG: class I SAM-dependent methyltransferase [Alphaproteobacteria bacterium]|nr:class I SAM-dependent methyltransferase [Alphaproteobacteria bacterium]MBL7099802.1 class I SAM-dependent methyltransferase [Alphaproteobacteria bacterium]